MKTYQPTLRVVGLLLAFTAVASASSVPKLSFKFTPFNLPGAVRTIPQGISNSGVVVGHYVDKDGVYHGFMSRGKKLTTIDPPNSTLTFCNGLSLDGAVAIVGVYLDSNNNGKAFLYKNGTFTDIPGPAGTTDISANGINDAGDIVGDYSHQNTIQHGFLLRGTTYTTLDVPGAKASGATGINNKGNIILSWQDFNGVNQASIYNGKTYKAINVPGATSSFSNGVNSAGEVVYLWSDSNQVGHGALLHVGKFYKFDYPKRAETWGFGINDRHVIVGFYRFKKTGPGYGYKATYK